MKILVTGASGQVGREICRRCLEIGHQVVAADREILDIRNAASVGQFVAAASPDVAFNAAGWTAVDDAENQCDEAFRVNRDGAGNLASACAEHSIPMVHYSTDYVFDGQKKSPYTEDDATNPISAYGRSKLAGEEAVRALHDKHLIIRTSWVFSSRRGNFVKTMLTLASERTELRVVGDQIGKPTSAATIADISLAMVAHEEADWGTYHLAQPEAVSWHEFAESIFESAARQGCELVVKDIAAISSGEFPTVATRPENSVLDCQKLENNFEIAIPDWHGALDSVIGELISDGFLT
ncbi:MAG: dTDP-4-dehydrorhamnose reductase [Woeseiaceae bacterium]